MYSKKLKYVYTIKNSDIGNFSINTKKTVCECCDQVIFNGIIHLSGFMGQIQNTDVGKQIYISKQGNYFIENDEQLQKRLFNNQ